VTAALRHLCEALVVLIAVGGAYEFVVVRRLRPGLWALVNTCSIWGLSYVAARTLDLEVAASALTGAMGVYAVTGGVAFGWRLHPTVFIPQLMHAAMLGLNALLLAGGGHRVPWAAGIVGALAFWPLHTHLLRRRADAAPLRSDPVLGPIFARLEWSRRPLR
jgi:hypothetical protein